MLLRYAILRQNDIILPLLCIYIESNEYEYEFDTNNLNKNTV